jgi:hypothetical protein
MIPETENKSSEEVLGIDKGVPLGEVLAAGDVKVSVSRQLNEQQVGLIYEMIRRGFAKHNQDSYLRQDMDLEEFEREARDQSVLKYLAENIDTSELQGYLSVHTNMDDVVWADPVKLKNFQHDFAPGEQSFYVSTFIVPKELRGFKISGILLEAALSQLINFNQQNGNRSLCFFDRSDAGSTAMREFIDRKLNKLTGSDPRFTISEVDRVTYYKPFNQRTDDRPISETHSDPPAGSEIIDIQHYYQITPPHFSEVPAP